MNMLFLNPRQWSMQFPLMCADAADAFVLATEFSYCASSGHLRVTRYSLDGQLQVNPAGVWCVSTCAGWYGPIMPIRALPLRPFASSSRALF